MGKKGKQGRGKERGKGGEGKEGSVLPLLQLYFDHCLSAAHTNPVCCCNAVTNVWWM